jgi:hypothetical protein
MDASAGSGSVPLITAAEQDQGGDRQDQAWAELAHRELLPTRWPLLAGLRGLHIC